MIELKTSACLEVVIESKIYKLQCDADSPLGCLHDALMQMKGHCVEKMKAAHQEEEAAVAAREEAQKQEAIPQASQAEVLDAPVPQEEPIQQVS
tara:strand:- start:412 stop:693 length:282 start_codon:yes stop_codon:yes gene_type:complete